MKKIFTVFGIIVLLSLLATTAGLGESATEQLSNIYAEAELAMATGDYDGAASIFDSLGVYSDATQMAMYCKALAAGETHGLYDVAITTFDNLGDFRDSKQMSAYYTARSNEARGDSLTPETADISKETAVTAAISAYTDAERVYTELALFKDCLSRLADCRAKRAVLQDLIEEWKEQAAREEAERIEAKYQSAVALEDSEKYFDAIAIYEELGDYKDSTSRVDNIKSKLYPSATERFFAHDYATAKEIFEHLGDYTDGTNPSSDLFTLWCERDMELPVLFANMTINHHDVSMSDRTYAYKCILHYLAQEGNTFAMITSENYMQELPGTYIAFGQTSGNGPGSFITGYMFDNSGNVKEYFTSYMQKIADQEPSYSFSAEGDYIVLTPVKPGKARKYYTVARMSNGYYAWFEDGDTGKAPAFFIAKVDENGENLVYQFSTDLSAPFE